MSDVEEPAAKMTKLDDPAETEEMENGQEEWLTEDILTDEDYNPEADLDQSDSTATTSQEDGNADSMDHIPHEVPSATGENIERTLNKLENAPPAVQAELPEELGAFLVRKTNGRVANTQPIKEPESEMDESTKQSEDDGNDTDDLLRMLGEDSNKKKETTASHKSEIVRSKETPHSSDEDDDEYIFEGATVTRLRVAKEVMRNKESNAKKLRLGKNLLMQKQTATRAVPEDTSDREADNDVKNAMQNIQKRETSSDEAMTVKKMFDMQQTKVSSSLASRRRGINAVKTVTKRVISIDPKGVSGAASPAPSNPPAKNVAKPQVMLQSKSKPPVPLTETRTVLHKSVAQNDLDEEELMNDDFHDMESEAEEEGGQRLMRPEQMDEEVPSDVESHTDDDSFYDEMPSSESEDADDWFTLDVRAERAADYIPMLGEDAKSLLMAEQQRAAARLGALRRSATALVAGRRSIATQLRIARSSLAQLDAALAQ